MNKTKRIAFGIGIVLAVLAMLAAPAAADGVVYFQPNPSTVSLAPGENVTIQIMADIDATESGVISLQVGVDFDPSVVNITDVTNPWVFEPYVTWWLQTFGWDNPSDEDPGPLGAWVWITAAHNTCYDAPATEIQVANLTIEGVSGGTSPLNFTGEIRLEPTRGMSWLFDCEFHPVLPTMWNNGTIECTGPVGPAESFTKNLVEDWNLISLPLTNETSMTVANIIDTSLSGSYDELYKYDATTHSFVSLSTSDAMENGVGYFIHMASSDTWTYSGTASNSMNVELSNGLNMVSWLDCSKDIVSDGALSSIDGNYYYVARWNAATKEFETYNPVAPDGFNDFTMLDRGEGYFISMKTGDTLAEGC